MQKFWKMGGFSFKDSQLTLLGRFYLERYLETLLNFKMGYFSIAFHSNYSRTALP